MRIHRILNGFFADDPISYDMIGIFFGGKDSILPPKKKQTKKKQQGRAKMRKFC